MDTSPPPDDPLASMFKGKRQSPRVPTDRGARVVGAGGAFATRVLDVSRGGVLFAVDDPSFYASGQDGLALVHQVFPEGLEIDFVAESVRLPASVVRMTPFGDGLIAIGCRFERALSNAENVLLGVRAADVEHPEALMATLPFAARPEEPVSLLLFTVGAKEGGPRSLGPVRAVGTRVLQALALAPSLPPGRLVRALLEGPLVAAVRRGVQLLWEGPVELLECRVRVENPSPTLRVLARDDLSRTLHGRFRPLR